MYSFVLLCNEHEIISESQYKYTLRIDPLSKTLLFLGSSLCLYNIFLLYGSVILTFVGHLGCFQLFL